MHIRNLKFLVYNPDGSKDFLIEYLEFNKHIVVPVTDNASFAAELIQSKYDVVIIDYVPGVEYAKTFLLEYLRDNAIKPIKVALLSSVNDNDMVQGYELDMDICMLLPINLQELLARIMVIDKYRTEKEHALANQVVTKTYVTVEAPGLKPKVSKAILPTDKVRAFGNFIINYTQRYLVNERGVPVFLFPQYFDIFVYMADYPCNFIPTYKIVEHFFGKITPHSQGVMRAAMNHIRKALTNCTYKFKTHLRRGYELYTDTELSVTLTQNV